MPKTRQAKPETAISRKVARKSTRAVDRISLGPSSPSPGPNRAQAKAQRLSSPKQILDLDESLEKMDQALTQIPIQAEVQADQAQDQIQVYLQVQVEAQAQLEAHEAQIQAQEARIQAQEAQAKETQIQAYLQVQAEAQAQFQAHVARIQAQKAQAQEAQLQAYRQAQTEAKAQFQAQKAQAQAQAMTLKELHAIDPQLLPETFQFKILDLFQAFTLDADSYWYLHRHLQKTPITIQSLRFNGPFLEITDLSNTTIHLWFPSPGDRTVDRPRMDKFLIRIPVLMTHGTKDSEAAVWYNTQHGLEDGLWDKILRFINPCLKTEDVAWKISAEDLKATDCFRKLRKFNEVYQRVTPLKSLEIGTDNAITTLSREELRICLEETHCDSSTFFKVNAPKYTGGLYHRKIQIQGASWLTVDCLLKMEDCEEFHAEAEVTLTSEDVNKFLIHWIKAEDQVLKVLVLAPVGFSAADMRKRILKDCQATRDPPVKLPESFRGHAIHPTETRYISSNDGKLAALMNLEGRFKMLVFDKQDLEDSTDSEE